eukprot:TRINITY_DN81083_c0_g1_i1.p1 TRINITY_DN81083_c0_g1~~TRINITY_DN81083_c0_g1_i1.p1  ORF type:complete len:209 (-),score=58.04 TRINITY_DN81083_c0_g1_i1:83-709(-)
MKFHFCGDADIPEWVLANLAKLSEITSVRAKLLALQVVNELTGKAPVDYTRVQRFTEKFSFTVEDQKAILACLAFILTQSVRFSVAHETLSKELEQLGLPREHCFSIGRTLRDHFKALERSLREEVLRVGGIDLGSMGWKVDVLLGHSREHSSDQESEKHVTVAMDWKTSEGKNIKFGMSADQFHALLGEMHRIRTMTNDIIAEPLRQ